MAQQYNSAGRSAAVPSGPQVFQMKPPRENLTSRDIYASGGGLLVAPINAPHLFTSQSSNEFI